ncbi:hypothetical protein BRADI_1g55055v3 [Brachypodium distachyon]|uniref:Uncharacterized protein n=1 Tax=Brachypodium distachyon TaxID=15368 RepID=A0A2K2DRH8_BRADI|nr:hypothetical protein BRADI_1g55055v3 [Brachypodium distachyon]
MRAISFLFSRPLRLLPPRPPPAMLAVAPTPPTPPGPSAAAAPPPTSTAAVSAHRARWAPPCTACAATGGRAGVVRLPRPRLAPPPPPPALLLDSSPAKTTRYDDQKEGGCLRSAPLPLHPDELPAAAAGPALPLLALSLDACSLDLGRSPWMLARWIWGGRRQSCVSDRWTPCVIVKYCRCGVLFYIILIFASALFYIIWNVFPILGHEKLQEWCPILIFQCTILHHMLEMLLPPRSVPGRKYTWAWVARPDQPGPKPDVPGRARASLSSPKPGPKARND